MEAVPDLAAITEEAGAPRVMPVMQTRARDLRIAAGICQDDATADSIVMAAFANTTTQIILAKVTTIPVTVLRMGVTAGLEAIQGRVVITAVLIAIVDREAIAADQRREARA